MADEIKKVKIKDLPQTTSIGDDDIFVESDSLETYKVVADDIAKYVSTNEHLTNKYVPLDSKGVANGVAPLNSNKKINGEYITYGKNSNTAYEGINGKTLEENLDNHLTDADAHGYETKINNEITRAKAAESTLTTKINKKLETSLKGVANGLAELDENGRVPSMQLPSYVDDVLEGRVTGVTQDETTGAITATGFILSGESTECTPESGKIYVDIDTNIQYRWSGTIYVTTGSNIALGETSSTAYRGDRGKIAYEHSQSVHAPSNAEVNQNAFSKISVGSTTISADSKTDTLTLAGNNVTITPDATNDKVTIGVTKSNIVNALGYTPEESGINSEYIAYGTCDTKSDVAEKAVTISDDSNWTLKPGSIVFVKFTNTNTATACTLNVNNTGAKSIWYDRTDQTSTTTTSANYYGYANRTLGYVYNGTYWVVFWFGYDANTTYTNASLGQGYGTCTTAASTTAKVVTLSSYALTTGGYVSVKFTYDVPANATMNINSKGAKSIYNRGSAITSGIIKAGDIATFIYNGSQYHLTSIDRDTDTKNTAGSTNTSSKLFLIGATSQAANPQTYSHDTAYVGTDGCLYSNSTRVVSEVVSSTEPTGQKIGDYWCQDY